MYALYSSGTGIQVWGKKLSGVEWRGAEWSRGVESVLYIELNCNNTQYMYIQEINVYLFLRYTKNMVTLDLNREIYTYIRQVNGKLLC